MTVKLAIPNKGRLNERAVELLSKSGIDLGEDWGRRLYVTAKEQDLEIMFIRAQDIPAFIESGAIDFGITGQDMVAESGYGDYLEDVLNLEFGVCRLSIAAPEASGIHSAKDIKDGTRIATSFPNLTKKYFDSLGKKVEITVVSGAAEIMPYLGVSDLICDLIATGSTLKINRMVEVCKIIDSQAAIFTSKEIAYMSSPDKKYQEIMDVVEAIRSVMSAEDKKYLMANIPKKKITQVEKIVPGINGPTILELAGNENMVAVQVVVSSKDMYKTISKLKKLGAEGILCMSIDRLVK
ncbi:MAG: ATP phosphoribosyltransferase [Candidatus Methanomethylophilaceae archaeon]|nr:ATP phosphoribosyltransferase [Candidatus Methanomethylophilaceae archaeon]